MAFLSPTVLEATWGVGGLVDLLDARGGALDVYRGMEGVLSSVDGQQRARGLTRPAIASSAGWGAALRVANHECASPSERAGQSPIAMRASEVSISATVSPPLGIEKVGATPPSAPVVWTSISFHCRREDFQTACRETAAPQV